MLTATHGEKAGSMEEYLFKIVQRVTLIVKTFPFVYAFGMISFWIVAPSLGCVVLAEIDNVMYMSAIMVVLLIRLSYGVKLCIWHRLQCVLPLLPQIVAFIDRHIYKFGLSLAITEYIAMCLTFILSLINAYFVFVKPMLIQWKRRRKATQV